MTKSKPGECKDCGEHPLADGRIRCDDCAAAMMAKSQKHYEETGEFVIFDDELAEKFGKIKA